LHKCYEKEIGGSIFKINHKNNPSISYQYNSCYKPPFIYKIGIFTTIITEDELVNEVLSADHAILLG
jgi:hypothetical protein